ncbi:MAG: serine protease [Amphritea sp.]|nr:serine protease [Amphritea sp.]
MRYLFIVCLLLLSGCEVAPVKDASSLAVSTPLDASINTPVKAPVAWYISQDEMNKIVSGQNGYGSWRFPTGPSLREASEVVLPSFFSTSEELEAESTFRYLFKLTSDAEYSNAWGTYTVNLKVVVIDRSGKELFRASSEASINGSSQWHDSYTSVYAKALKDITHQFLNHMSAEEQPLQISTTESEKGMYDFDLLLKEIEPAGSGTGFFINRSGQVLTASHVINGCLKTEIRHKGANYPVSLLSESRILDLAVLQSELSGTTTASIPEKAAQDASLGQHVFVTGYPLGSIMSDYPSLTMGNISSLGGLKGALSNLQFSAPVQPGNSGGPIINYKGNTVGVVTGTLNQSMMLASTGTTSQNVNFGVRADYIRRFLENSNVEYGFKPVKGGLESASKQAVEYTVQILCYR